MRYNYFLWDLDGTLTDPKEGITRCVQYSLESLGHPVPDADQLEWIIGPPLPKSFSLLLNTEDESIVKEAVALYRERYGEKGMFENRLYPGMKELLSELKLKGCHNILATSKPRVYAEKILQHFGLDSLFTLIMGSKLNGELSDKGELIKFILENITVPNLEEAVMIGDRIYDINGAKKNNIDVISVLFGYGSTEEIEEGKPTYKVNSIKELKDLLLGQV